MNQIVLLGQPPSGKNSIKTTRTGHRYPSKRFALWRDQAVIHVKIQWRSPIITKPCAIKINYWPGDLRRRDVPGICDAIFHVLERAGVTADDTFFQDVHFITKPIDRKNPRVTMEIYI